MIFCILLGVTAILFFTGNYLLDNYNESIDFIAIAMILASLAGVVLIFFCFLPSKKVEAKNIQNVRICSGGGITAHMNALRYAYMNEPELVTDESEIELLAKLMTAEQGYHADEYDYYLTGSVVLNRVRSEKFPNSIYEVIYQSGQYQCIQNGSIERDYDDVAWEVAEELLTEGTNINEHIIYQAEFTQGSGIYEKRGNTFYCYQ